MYGLKNAPLWMNREERAEWILHHMTEYVRENSLDFTGKQAEEHLGISRALIYARFKDVAGLIDAIVSRAQERQDHVVIGRAVLVGHRFLMDIAQMHISKARRAVQDYDVQRQVRGA